MRVGAGLTDLLEQFGGDQFVTALLMRLDLTDGRLDVVNAGQWRADWTGPQHST
jgi:hypothetical protein